MAEGDDRIPVLVGAAAVQQKIDDYLQAAEPVDLMERALRDAAADAGSAQLLALADEIMVPNSLWPYGDPARLLADRIGAPAAQTLLADFGILQQSLIDRACQRIASGEAKVLLIAGGEARYREQRAARAGAEPSYAEQSGAQPDTLLQPDAELMSAVESDAGLGMPVGYYAIMDSALRYAQGKSIEQHRDEMAELCAHCSGIAARNPDAWSDEPVAASLIREHSAENRMLAFPYTKLHNSQWNVDQAAGLILCSVSVARSLGIDSKKWVYPVASVESNFMAVLSSRAHLGASEGFRHVGREAMRLSGTDFNDIRLRELYSCFPFAVRVQMAEFGIDSEDSNVSVTGGMTFGGGPLNNFVFQATVKMIQLLREAPGETGLVTTVSGMMTKQACCLWSTVEPEGGWQFSDVTEAVREDTVVRDVIADYAGEGVVAGYTVLYQGMEPWRAVAVFDLPEDRRTVAYSEDPSVMAAMMESECCGERFKLIGGQFR